MIRKKITCIVLVLMQIFCIFIAVPQNAYATTEQTPMRIAGLTSLNTAIEISIQTGWDGAAILAPAGETGTMGDALAAGTLSFALKAPILLNPVGSTSLHAETKNELTRLRATTVYVTSGSAVIPQSVLDEITAMGINVISLGGYDRAETSVNIAKQLNNVNRIAVVNSISDALSIASIASAANQPILLVDRYSVSDSVKDYLSSNPQIVSTDVIGGTGIISDAAANQFPNVTRHCGHTAYDTNNQVIQDFSGVLKFDVVYTANGETALDALSGAPLTAMTNSPIVLTNGREVPLTAIFIANRLGANGQVIALGGTAVVPESVRDGIVRGEPTTLGTVTIQYNANGGDGAPSIHSVSKDSSGAVRFTLSSTIPTKSGCTFLGWKLDDSANNTIVNPGESLVLNTESAVYSNETLIYYAQWNEVLAGYLDPEQYVNNGWSGVYCDIIVDGYYYNKQGYQITEDDYKDMLEKRNNIYAEVIKDDMSEYDKVQVLHDWICENMVYNTDVYNNGTWNEEWKPTKYSHEHQLGWAGLILGTAVCAGYADAYQFLLDGLGIESYYVIGPIPNWNSYHAWNIVRVNGAYYHVDTTWDDIDIKTSHTYYHRYFLISDYSISSEESSVDYRKWARSNYPACPSNYKFPKISIGVNNSLYGQAYGQGQSYGLTGLTFDKTSEELINGTIVRLSAQANDEYVFAYWEVVSGNVTISAINSPDTTFTMPNNDVSIKAHFKPVEKYTVDTSVNDNSYGTASTNLTKAIPGATVFLNANAYRGYEFDYWQIISGNITISNESSDIASFTMPNNDVSVKAYFKPAEKHTVVTSVNDDSYGIASANLTQAVPGTTVYLNASAYSGYEFDYWQITSENYIIGKYSSARASFQMPNYDVYLMAYFKPIEEYVEPDEEYVEPDEEHTEPVEEYIEPDEEHAEPDEEYTEPVEE